MELKETDQITAQPTAAAEPTPSPAASLKGKLAAMKQSKPKKRSKKGRNAIILVLVLVAAVLFWKLQAKKPADTAVTYTKASVERQDISEELSGSGTLQPADTYTVTALVSGEITADYFEEGDTVSEGDVLYTLDSSNASSGVTQAQMNYQTAVDAKYPKATMSGIVKEVFVHNGDTVNSGTAICEIVGSNRLVIDFLFSYTSANDFYVGQEATVYINSFAGTLTGTVTAVSASYTVSSNGKELSTVRVEVDNPGLVTADYTATAVVGGNYSYGDASIRMSGSTTVTASGSGTVKGLSLLAGDSVASGATVCTIESDSIDKQITNAKLSLDNSHDTLDNYSITSPISGTVVDKNAKAGDNLSSSANSGGMATIYDLTYLKMTLSIDELDISKVSVGQRVSITADAVEGDFTGYVSKVSIAGNTSGGVTTYPVTIIIEDYGALRPAMNVNALIVTSEVSDVLTVPNAAVGRGNTVLLTADSPSAKAALADSSALPDSSAPEGYVTVSVETGISNDNFIEIISGLQEGDTVAYIPPTASGSMNMMMMGMSGDMAMSEAAPAGDMSGGRPDGGSGGPRG